MSIWFDCKKCGVALEATENKAGFRIACPKCRARNKIPGIAMQSQATKEQIEQLQAALNRHRQSLWMFLMLLIFIIGTAIITALFSMSNSTAMNSGLSVAGIGILIGYFVIFVRILKTCEYLGASKYIQLFLFLFLSAIWVIVCFVLYMKLKKRIAHLKMAGVRGNEALEGRFTGLL